MIDILQFISTFIGVSLHAHHYKWFERVEYSLLPEWHPIIIPSDNALDYFIIGLAFEREIGMIESVYDDTDIP
jgi:hypothetical protein